MKGKRVSHMSIYTGEGRVKGKQQRLAKYQGLAKPFHPCAKGKESLYLASVRPVAMGEGHQQEERVLSRET